MLLGLDQLVSRKKMETEYSGHKGLHGVMAASLTPMKDDLTIDHERLVAHCDWLLSSGCNGIAFMGTTGEANSLSVAERMIALDAVIEAGIPAEQLMVGTGCCALPDTLALWRHALAHQVGGMLMLPPFYYKGVSEDGVFAAFDAVIQRIGDDGLRIYLYHFPYMSAVPFSHKLIERLLKHYPGIIAGIKDSSGDWENMRSMASNFSDFDVFAGTEQYLLDVLRAGGVGCISASANVTCSLAAEVYKARETPKADALQEQLTQIRRVIQTRAMIPALKGFVARHRKDDGWKNFRPPHISLSQDEISNLENELESLAFAISG